MTTDKSSLRSLEQQSMALDEDGKSKMMKSLEDHMSLVNLLQDQNFKLTVDNTKERRDHEKLVAKHRKLKTMYKDQQVRPSCYILYRLLSD